MKKTGIVILLLTIGLISCEENVENPNQEVIVSTVAGSDAGHKDGPAADAMFSGPTRLEVGNDGTVFVVEKTMLRKISADGIVSTVAGSIQEGYENGQGINAKFKALFGIAIAPDGTIYLTDAGNFCIRRIDNQGNVTTYAGSGVEGYKDGSAANAQFGNMGDLIIDDEGNLLICDAHNHRIRKVTPDGTVSTIAGGGEISVSEGPALEVGINGTMDLVLNSNNKITFLDSWGHRVSELNNGMISVIAGDLQMDQGFADGMGLNARFINPMGIAISDDGILIIADTWNNRIRIITKDHEVKTIAGDGTYGYADGKGEESMFNQPFDIDIAPDGSIYIADTYNNKIRKINYK